jgi:colanic acid biosynthesis glycosyl transferase WcaI
MKVLIFTLVFPPDGVSTAQLLGELAEDLARAGHEVSVVTTQPHYNRDDIALATQPLTPLWGSLLFRSTFRGIPVFHVRMPPRGRGIARRLWGWLVFHKVGFLAALRFGRADVILVPSPLLSGGVVAWMLCRVWGARYIYMVYEMYPDLAIRMGHLSNPIAIRLLRALETFVYHTASRVTALTRGMAERLCERGVPAERVKFVPPFVDLNDLKPGSRENAFRAELGVGDAFVVSYFGNMGHAQGLEVLLEAADQLRDANVRLVLVGDGVLRDDLVRDARKRGLQNVIFLPHQPYARIPDMYAASDVCIVPLLGEVGIEAIPSKVYRIMACARPVLAVTSPTSDLARVVTETGAGVCVLPDASAVADAIRNLLASSGRLASFGAAGRRYATSHVARAVVTREYDLLVRSLAPAG